MRSETLSTSWQHRLAYTDDRPDRVRRGDGITAQQLCAPMAPSLFDYRLFSLDLQFRAMSGSAAALVFVSEADEVASSIM